MPEIYPIMLFEDNCAEAMQFYQGCIGGDLTLIKLGDTPMAQDFSQAQRSKVVHGFLKSRDI